MLEAYELVLRQLHERQDYEQGRIAEEDLKYWRPGETIKNVIRVEAGHTIGKTKLVSGIFSHFLDCFPPAIIYTFAPSWPQIHDLLWKEVVMDRRTNSLPGRILYSETTCRINITENHFATGRSTSDAGGKGTERIQGQHGAYLMLDVDEAEGVEDYVFDAIDSMASGGIAIVILTANPRTRTSRFHKIASRSTTRNFRISCLNHPNVQAGREIVPAAVKRTYVLEMVEKCCEPVAVHNEDEYTFDLPYPVTKLGMVYPAGTIWKPDTEFCFRVLGVAPANSAHNTFVPVGRYEAATKRKTEPNDPTKARIGVDVARFGNDPGTVYVKHNGAVWRHAKLAQQDTNVYARSIKDACRSLITKGVKSIHVRVDGGGGFGGGVVDQIKKDAELIGALSEFVVLEVHNNGTPHDEKAFANLGTEMYAHSAESLKGLAILGPVPEALEADLCERTFSWVNKGGVDVKVLTPKDQFRKDHNGRSPDDGDGFALAVAPDFLFAKRKIRLL